MSPMKPSLSVSHDLLYVRNSGDHNFIPDSSLPEPSYSSELETLKNRPTLATLFNSPTTPMHESYDV